MIKHRESKVVVKKFILSDRWKHPFWGVNKTILKENIIRMFASSSNDQTTELSFTKSIKNLFLGSQYEHKKDL